MTMPIIDASRNSIRQSFLDKGVVGTLHHALWSRIFRPVLVILTWGLLGLHVGYSISSVGPSGLSFEQLCMYDNIIAGMGGALVAWVILFRLDRAVRRKIARTPAVPTASAGVTVRASRGVLHGQQQPAWQRPRNTRLPVVDHDDDGDITHVRSWQEWAGRPAPTGTATPPTPFTRSLEHDPDEPVLGLRLVGEAIVLEILDRAEPSLAGSDASAQPPRDVAKAADAIAVDAADFHRFGYRGRLGRSDWIELTPHELAAQTYVMRPGMARYYGSVTAVVHGRAAVQAADRAVEYHRTWHASGTHAQVEDPRVRLQRAEHIDLLHGSDRRDNIAVNDA